MANLIFVGGTSHGGWYFEGLVAELEKQGHICFAPDLSGLGTQVDSSRAINLDTHIGDVLELIAQHGLSEVVLVGHSYGGMVITGVADRTQARVDAMVFLDAAIPESGQSLWSLIDQESQENFLKSAPDGLFIQPNPDFLKVRPRLRPHPLATKLQTLTYSEKAFSAPVKVFVFAEKYFGVPGQVSPFKRISERLAQDPAWQVEIWPYGHDLVAEAPERLVELISSTARSSSS